MDLRRREVLAIIQEEREGSPPTIHPNGFVQLKLVGGRRMHFWHPEIPRQKVGSPIHDHIFDMESEIVLGKLFHREVKIIPQKDGYYVIWEAVPVRDTETELVTTGDRVMAEHCAEQELHPGDRYFFPAFTFHLTRDAFPAISIIKKRAEHEGKPRVLVPAGQKPDNSFTRDAFEPEFIEQLITRVVDEAHSY